MDRPRSRGYGCRRDRLRDGDVDPHRDPPGHDLGLLELTHGRSPVGAPPAEHAARDARPRLLGVLRQP